MKRGAAAALAVTLAGCVAPAARVAPPAVVDAPAPILPPASPASLIARADLSGTRAALAAAGMAGVPMAGTTLIAPDDAAWARLPAGTAAALLEPGNRPSLRRLLRYWTVPGRLTPADLATRAAAGRRLPTLAGEAIAFATVGDAVMLTDASGRRAYVTGGAASDTGAVLVVNGLIAPASITPGGSPDR